MVFRKIILCLALTTLFLTGCEKADMDMAETMPPRDLVKEYYMLQKENLLELGVINLRGQDIEKSIELLEVYTTRYPNQAIGQFYLGKAYYKNMRYEDSIKKFKRAYNLDSSVVQSLLYLGKAYKRTGENQKALKVLYKYISSEFSDVNRARDEINKMAEPVMGKHVIGRVFVSDDVLHEKNIALSMKSCFPAQTPEIYASIELLETPAMPEQEGFSDCEKLKSIEGSVISENRNSNAFPICNKTEIRARWNYFLSEEEKVEVNSISFKAEGAKNTLLSFKKPFTGWKEGEYELEIFVNNEKNVSLIFYIF